MGILDAVVADALNRQITNERQNSAIYLAIGNRFDVLNLLTEGHLLAGPGFARKMGKYPVPDVYTLAHVQGIPVVSVKHVDAG